MKTYKILQNGNGVIKPSPKSDSLIQGTSIMFVHETGHTLIFNKTDNCGFELVAVVPSGFIVIEDKKPILNVRPLDEVERHPEI